MDMNDQSASLLGHTISLRAKALGSAMNIDRALCRDIRVFVKERLDPVLDHMMIGMKGYVFGGDDREFVLSLPDGPWNRFKSRHRWARTLFGPTKLVSKSLLLTTVYPDTGLVLPSGIGNTMTVHVSGGDAAVSAQLCHRPDEATLIRETARLMEHAGTEHHEDACRLFIQNTVGLRV